MSILKTGLRLTLLLATLLLLGAASLVVLAIDDQPVVTSASSADPAQARRVKQLATRAWRNSSRSQRPTPLIISENDANSLFALLSRAYPAVKGYAKINTAGATAALTITLPQTPLGRYLSIRTRLPAASDQLRFDYVQIGSLNLPGRLLNTLLAPALNLLLGNNEGDLLLQSVRIATSRPQQLTLLINPVADLKQRADRVRERLQGLRSEGPGIEAALVSHYYRQLILVDHQYPDKQAISLARFIQPLLQNAAQRSEYATAQQHNQSALFALALYLGTQRFEQLTGPMLSDELRGQRSQQATTLRGREDLRLHFVYSIALQLLAKQGISQAVGEFKELLDSNRGGSGFSFADLAADRAGTRFAQLATQTPASARRLQNRVGQSINDQDLLFTISSLPEGLTAEAFTRSFQNVESTRYQQLVARIDQQLTSLRVYDETP